MQEIQTQTMMDDDGMGFMETYVVSVRYREFMVDEVVMVDRSMPWDVVAQSHIGYSARLAYARVRRIHDDYARALTMARSTGG